MRIRVRVPCDFRDRIEHPFRRGVVAQHAVAFSREFESTNGIWFGLRAMPHFLPLHEERVPVVVVGVGAEDPVVSLRSRSCHRGFESAAIYTGTAKKRNKMLGLPGNLQ